MAQMCKVIKQLFAREVLMKGETAVKGLSYLVLLMQSVFMAVCQAEAMRTPRAHRCVEVSICCF